MKGGYLNKSYIIKGDEGKFFLQEINKDRDIKKEIGVLSFLRYHGFTAVPQVIKNKDIMFGDKRYIVTNFIKGYSPAKFNDLSLKQIEEAGRNLAILHKHLKRFSCEKTSSHNTATFERAIRICQEVLKKISEKDVWDRFDMHVLEVIDLKIHLLKNYNRERLDKKISKCPQIFCHGDYHGANLIFKNDKIVGVVDWEYFGYDYRIWEVARSMSFICDIDYTGSMLGPISFRKARRYLKAYDSVLPLTKEEKDVMVDILKFKSLCSCFVLEKHYLENTKSCDIFLPKKPSNWFWWIKHGNDFKEKVL